MLVMKKAARAVGFVALGSWLSTSALGQSCEPTFKILVGNDPIWSLDPPRRDGGQLAFHRCPDGVFVSVKQSAVTSVDDLRVGTRKSSSGIAGGDVMDSRLQMRASEEVLVTATKPGLEPGEVLYLGPTAPPTRVRGANLMIGPPTTASSYVPRPGEGLPGKALFNPNRDYRPEWDSKLVPGYSMPFANSPNDYAEGRTLAYPPGNGVQGRPGHPPTIIYDGTEPPQTLSRPGGWTPPVNNTSIEPKSAIGSGAVIPRVPDTHEVPTKGYDPSIPPPGWNPNPEP